MPNTPSRMSREDFTRRVLFFATNMIALGGADPPPEMVTDAKALFGAAWRHILGALRDPPWICPTCMCLHHAAEGGPCYECETAVEEQAKRAAMRAEVEAEVRAEMAQKGNVKP